MYHCAGVRWVCGVEVVSVFAGLPNEDWREDQVRKVIKSNGLLFQMHLYKIDTPVIPCRSHRIGVQIFPPVCVCACVCVCVCV